MGLLGKIDPNATSLMTLTLCLLRGLIQGKESDGKEKVHFAPFVDKYLVEVPENVRLNLAFLYKSYDYHKMFAYLSTPAFCETVKVKHVLHAASLKKMRKRWTAFESPKRREGRGQNPGSSAAQAGSVVDSTLEIIDMSELPESPRREVHVGVVESSSPHVGRFAEVHVGTRKHQSIRIDGFW